MSPKLCPLLIFNKKLQPKDPIWPGCHKYPLSLNEAIENLSQK